MSVRKPRSSTDSASTLVKPEPGRNSGSTNAETVWERLCSCGQRLKALRTTAAQKIVCDECQQAHFVLPLNPYPALSFRRKNAKRRGLNDLAVWRRSKQVLAAGSYGTAVLCATLTEHCKKQEAACRRQLVQTVKTQATPLRMTMLALIFACLIAGLVGFRQYQYQQAVQTLRTSLLQAEQAVTESDWLRAHLAFADASRALKQLNRTDPFAQEIFQKDREYRACARLSALPLHEMIDEASGRGKLGNRWEATFAQMVESRSLVLDCELVPLPADAQTSTDSATEGQSRDWLHLSQPIPVGDEWLDIHWPAALLAGYPQNEKQPAQRVFCAGEIESLKRPQIPDKLWVLTIRPDSAFLWCNPESVKALGYPLENSWDPSRNLDLLLEQQRQQVLKQEQP